MGHNKETKKDPEKAESVGVSLLFLLALQNKKEHNVMLVNKVQGYHGSLLSFRTGLVFFEDIF
jgi:hypothetical protein